MLNGRDGMYAFSHLGRVSVLAVVLFLLMAVNGWASCYTSSISESYRSLCPVVVTTSCKAQGGLTCSGTANFMCGDDRMVVKVTFVGGCYESIGHYVASCGEGCYAQNGTFSCPNATICTTQPERDSVECENGGNSWNSSTASCDTIPECDAECQCLESGGEWRYTNGGYCVPKCETQFCCDSIDQNLPTEVDTTWEGCVATDPANDKCVIIPTTITTTSISAECTAKSRYRICTTRYVYSKTAGQCGPISTNNCVTMDRQDSMCTKVLCHAYQEKSISSLNYNPSTKCYDGVQTVMEMMVCDNGIRQSRGSSQEQFQVCDSYLDDNDITLEDYLKGPQGPGPGPGPGPDFVDDPNDPNPGPNPNPQYPDYGDVYSGGPSVNGEGDTVQNSPSPYIGDVWFPQQEIVTEYDSSTGTTTIVKNSEGGDSVRTVVSPSGIRCLGVSGGVATLTDGVSTWTCEAQSCSQATLSASIVGGSCSENPSGPSTPNNINYTNNDHMPTIIGSSPSSASSTTNFDFGQWQADMNAGFRNAKTHTDSLWFATFGDNLDAVKSVRTYFVDFLSEIRETLDTVSTANLDAISSASQSNWLGLLDVRDNIVNRLNVVNSSINSASSQNSQDLQAVATSINSASSQHTQSLLNEVQVFRQSYVDSVHESNSTNRAIFAALDTGGIVNRDINAVRHSVDSAASAFRTNIQLVKENQLVMIDTAHNTNVLLSEISDKLDNISGNPSSSSSAELVDVDTVYTDSGDYALDPDLVYQDSVTSGQIQSILDSMSGMVVSSRRGLDSVIAHVDSVRVDSNNNWLAMDSIYKWGKDTTVIKQKFSKFFLPSQVSSNCFACTYKEKWGNWDVDLRFDLANIYGFNFCEFIRTMVRVIVSITIIFSTIAAFIRAFGGGGGGSP